MVRESNPGWGRDFPQQSLDRLWGPPSLLHNGYRVEEPGNSVEHQPPSIPFFDFVTCSRMIFTFTYTLTFTLRCSRIVLPATKPSVTLILN
jgi:hypothetical protein